MATLGELKIKPVKEPANHTIGQQVGISAPAAWTSSKVVPLESPYPGLLYGIELEIEEIPDDHDLERHASEVKTGCGND